MKVSKLRPFSIAIASLATSSAAFAAMDMDSRVTQLETQMQQVRTETAMGTYGANTASARAEVDGQGWCFNADVLYWHAKVGGTEYAYSKQGSQTDFPVNGRSKDIDFDWDWGLRVGLGYNFQHDGWDLSAQYTYFDTNGSNSAQAGMNSALIPLRGSATITNGDGKGQDFLFCSTAKSQYGLDFQSLDVQLGRAYYVSSKLSFRPAWGLKSAWIDQNQKTRYTGGTASASAMGLGATTVHIKDENDFWGLGPCVGVDSRWHLGNGFSLLGNVGGALLFGHFDVKHKEHWSNHSDAKIDLTANRHAFAPNMQMQLGLHYDKYINDSKQHIGIGLGFEANYWWRQNQMLKIDDAHVLKYERYAEDISMHGVTLDFKWDF